MPLSTHPYPLLASFPLRRALLFTGSAVLAILALSNCAFADTIELKNGDHLTGKVTQLVGGKLTLTTTYAGALTITWDDVTSVKLDKPLILPIETKTGKKIDIRKLEITSIERTGTGFTLTSASGPEQLPAVAVTTIRDAAAQLAYEASLKPNFLHGWIGSANASVALARGNSDTTSIGSGVNLSRPTRTDKTSVYFTSLFTHDGILNQTTANATTSGVRYDHNLAPKIFAFGTADFADDQLQYLDLRAVAGGGIGYHVTNKPFQQFDVLAGVVYTHEAYSTVPANPTAIPPTPLVPPEVNNFAALEFGQQFTRKLGKLSSFTEQAYIFPDLNDISQYRFTINSGLSTKINNLFSWQTTFSDIYVTNPPAGTKDNDLILTTGLGFNFTKK